VPDDEAVIGATAYRYAHEVIVEVTCRGADDDLVVYSYAFRSDDDGELRPAGTVPDRHCEVVADALAEKDVEPATDFRGAAG
jgi:hypothetical protein